MDAAFAQDELFGFNKRDVACVLAAVLIHSLLLMWKASPFQLLDSDKEKIGETLFQVEFRTEYPAEMFSKPVRKKTFFSRMKTFFKKPPERSQDEDLFSTRRAPDKISANQKYREQEKPQFRDKQFEKKMDFKEVSPQSEVGFSMSKNKAVVAETEIRDMSIKTPALKDNKHSLAEADAPFNISRSRDADALSFPDSVVVPIGKKTSKSLVELNSPALGGEPKVALQESAKGKSVASFGTDDLSLRGAGGRPSLPRSSFKEDAFSQMSRSGSSPDSILPKRTSSKQKNRDVSKDGFFITGPLENRQIRKKVTPPAEFDARVSLRFRVNAKGQVLSGIVVEISSGNPSFDRKVIKAVKEWEFSPLPPHVSQQIQEGVVTIVFKGV